MELTGRLIQVLQEQGGEGKNGKWAKCDFVIETSNEKYPKKVCLTAWNDLIGTVKAMPMESEIKVSFDISSREYNGKWYTDVKAWKVEGGSGGGQQSSNRGGNQSNNNRGNNSNNYSQENSYSGPQEGSQERYVSEDDLPF
ncbi:MAG: DUF3127 domain-containing protein [Bacteroidetes bacterium]|nr:DUF3127 domain-containing protein [Bacteroidota bacterium]